MSAMRKYALLALAGFTTVASACTDRVVLFGEWWNLEWTARLPISLQQSDRETELIDFPLLVQLDASNFDYAIAASDGSDLRAVERASGRVIPHEIDAWVPGGTSSVWVRAPVVTFADEPVIDLYFGNPNAEDVQDGVEVFANDYVGVFHLGDHVWDSSGAMNDGMNFGSTPIDAPVSSGRYFAFEEEQEIEIGDALLPAGGEPRTLCAFARTDDLENRAHHTIASYGEFREDGTEGQTFFIHRYSNSLQCGGAITTLVVPELFEIDRWYHVCCTYDGTEAALYVDGVERERDRREWLVRPEGRGFIGNMNGLARENWSGSIDEVRFSRTIRSSAWIDAEYRSMTGGLTVYGPLERL
jgi:hypothetical protein